MKKVDINWSITQDKKRLNIISFANIARGKATVAVSDNFELDNEEGLKKIRIRNNISEREFTNEEVLGFYLGEAWSKVLAEKLDYKFLNLIQAKEEAILEYFNEIAKSKNIGMMTHVEVEKFEDQDIDERPVELNGKKYKLATTTIQTWTLVKENKEEKVNAQKAENSKPKKQEKEVEMKPVRNVHFNAEAMLDD